MFKLLSKVKRALEPKVDDAVIIAKIHNEFDTAGDKLLAEAKEILSGNFNTEKGERLKKLGFVKSKSATDAEEAIKIKKEQKYIAERVEYFRTYYPNNKFITEALVKIICKKYNLVFGEINYYKGDVPEKNITEMESFKLREEDMYDCYDFDYDYSGGLYNGSRSVLANSIDLMYQRALMQAHRYKATPNGKKSKQSFKICAPESDFDMTYMVRKGHKIELHIPDPIVLQPVNGGYLIVSKWGLEGKDESLTNEISN